MQSISNSTDANAVRPPNLKSQLKKLSGSKANRKELVKNAKTFNEIVTNNKPVATDFETQKLPDHTDGQQQANSAQNTPRAPIKDDSANASTEIVTTSDNNVSIASLSVNETIQDSEVNQFALANQSDTLVTQSPFSTPVTTASASAPAVSSFSWTGLGVAFGAVALGAGKGGGATQTASTTQAPTAVPQTLSGFIAAGPMISNGGLKVEAFDTQGNLLATTTDIQADGSFSVRLSNSYTGVVKLIVSDINQDAINFIDEATGQAKSLGASPLVSIFSLTADQTTMNVNVNTLTTEAATNMLSLAGGNLANVTSTSIHNANLDIANQYGISIKEEPEALVSSKPSLIINADGSFNTSIDDYGLALAIRSVLDNNPGMQIKEAFKALATNPLYATKKIETTAGLIDWSSAVYGFGANFLKNSAPTGSLTISGNANSPGQVLTATSTIADADGIPQAGSPGAMIYSWQASSDGGTTWTNIEGASGANATTFTITPEQTGKLVRTLAGYIDNFGAPQSVYSAPVSIAQALNPLKITSTGNPASASQIGDTQSFAAGDVNGDGIADWVFAIQGSSDSNAPQYMPRKMYVLFGNTSGTYDLNSLDPNKGFSISVDSLSVGASPQSSTYSNPMGVLAGHANDFNGDGHSEIFIYTGTQNSDPFNNFISLQDQSHLTTSAPLFRLNLGYSYYLAADAGDVNGDGFSDLLEGNISSNNAFVFYGNSSLREVSDLETLPPNYGFKIYDSQQNLDLSLGLGVSYLGDANGDGYGDMAITQSYSADPTLGTHEEVFVIFGQPSTSDIDINAIRTGASQQGFVINADPLLPFLGFDMGLEATKVAGDFNGDGLSDFVFEGQTYDHTAAKFYVVFGKQDTSPINLNALGSHGFSIGLPSVALTNVINLDKNMAHDSVANCGDVNGDGIDDMLVSLAFDTSEALGPYTTPGAALPDASTKTNHLLAYVVYGKTDLTHIDLNNLGDQGFKVFEGSKTVPMATHDYGTIAAVGDINGDGLADFVLDDYDGSHGGMPTVLLGSALNQPVSQWKVSDQGGSDDDTLISSGNDASETFIGGAGNDTLQGNGGADVMYGGAGNDNFILNANNITQLHTLMQEDGRLARINGGGGIDTLTLDGTQIDLDLSTISNTRIQSIEKINLGTANTLTVSWQDIQNMAAMNIFNQSTTGWSGFSADAEKYHQLIVDGEATSSIKFLNEGGWVQQTITVQNAGNQYAVYTNTLHGTELFVNQKIVSVF